MQYRVSGTAYPNPDTLNAVFRFLDTVNVDAVAVDDVVVTTSQTTASIPHLDNPTRVVEVTSSSIAIIETQPRADVDPALMVGSILAGVLSDVQIGPRTLQPQLTIGVQENTVKVRIEFEYATRYVREALQRFAKNLA